MSGNKPFKHGYLLLASLFFLIQICSGAEQFKLYESGITSEYTLKMYQEEYRQFHFENFTDAYQIQKKKATGPDYEICFTEQPKFKLSLEQTFYFYTHSHILNWFYSKEQHLIYVLSSELHFHQYKTMDVNRTMGQLAFGEYPSLKIQNQNKEIKTKLKWDASDLQNARGQFFQFDNTTIAFFTSQYWIFMNIDNLGTEYVYQTGAFLKNPPLKIASWGNYLFTIHGTEGLYVYKIDPAAIKSKSGTYIKQVLKVDARKMNDLVTGVQSPQPAPEPTPPEPAAGTDTATTDPTATEPANADANATTNATNTTDNTTSPTTRALQFIENIIPYIEQEQQELDEYAHKTIQEWEQVNAKLNDHSKFDFRNINLLDIQCTSEGLVQIADSNNGVLSFQIKEINSQDLQLNFVKEKSVYLPTIQRFGVWEETLVATIYDEEQDPFLMELFYYSQATPKMYKLNRLQGDIVPVNIIRMDDTYAYLIGRNLHFAYRHSVNVRYLTSGKNTLYEFVDRNLYDMVQMEGIRGTHEIGFSKRYFYVFKQNGIDIMSLSEEGPSFTCKPDKLASKDMSKLIGKYSYTLSFYEKNCPAKEKSLKIDDNKLFVNCLTKSQVNIDVQKKKFEKTILDDKTKKDTFELGVASGAILFVIVLCCGLSIGLIWYKLLKKQDYKDLDGEHVPMFSPEDELQSPQSPNDPNQIHLQVDLQVNVGEGYGDTDTAHQGSQYKAVEQDGDIEKKLQQHYSEQDEEINSDDDDDFKDDFNNLEDDKEKNSDDDDDLDDYEEDDDDDDEQKDDDDEKDDSYDEDLDEDDEEEEQEHKDSGNVGQNEEDDNEEQEVNSKNSSASNSV